MRDVMDQNWKEFHGELGASLNTAMSQVMATIFSGMFNRVPLELLFLDYK